ncbi:hypothetical protein ALC57_17524 [Trachymyrmex cornetzi]|uniref:Uncharacterized protein n=1 Tax=Trachymyrmex cornetzi TaxID=471704 RepID=A0A195DBX3_9HYME|nr:hypothetical protein ALC57_17524 [Trachymyrmex cornetzi]
MMYKAFVDQWIDNKFSVKDSNYLITLHYHADVSLSLQLTLTSSHDPPESSVVLLNPQQLKLFLLFSVYSKASAGNAELNQEQKE